MSTVSELRAPDIQSALRRYRGLLRDQQEPLNRLNVYPVPDGDTGSNMLATMDAVIERSDTATDMDEVAASVAHGSLMGAQGNSGIILSQVLRAVSSTIEGRTELDAAGFVEAVGRAASAAYEAVGRPVEGTILTVLRETAESLPASDHQDLRVVVRDAYRVAEESLRRTPDLLPVLAEAGVVDAGGAGLLLLFAALFEEVTGESAVLPGDLLEAEAAIPDERTDLDREKSIADLRYEIMFLLEGPDGAGDRLKDAWGDIGDSIVVVGGDGEWNCHIHSDHIGAAIEAGITEGRPHRIRVTDLLEQAAAEEIHGPSGFEPLPEARKAKVGLIAVAAGTGVVELFRGYGAQDVVVGGQTMNPSVGDLLDAVERVHAKTIIVLPNNKNVVPAAQELDALTKKSVHVVPTTSIVQGVATLIAYQPDGDAGRIAGAMEDAGSVLTSGEMTRAVRDAKTPAGAIKEGDWLGLVDGKVTVISASGGSSGLRRKIESWMVSRSRFRHWVESRERAAEQKALIALLEAVVQPGHEIVTLLTGQGAHGEVTDGAVTWLRERSPGVEIQVIEGGQPLYPYLVGSE